MWQHGRPITELPQIRELITPLSNWKSFPSDHTAVAFTITFYFLQLAMVWGLGIVLLIGAIMVPMLMELGVSPDLTQAAYRVGDSSTNIITKSDGVSSEKTEAVA